ncbi:MAG: hypothetical protein PHW25_00495 [Zoogloea sp.]|uniref:hypothetical protein n=1 Tax=Zoogloea sp. TaxID=49181 RepID=UPI002628B68E|nr:hypothetical protein [Zoogloea sp.]MDD3325547.1 hypothetical protein [Zoogloea sp.]
MNTTPETKSSSSLGGLFIRTSPEGASLSIWVQDSEITVELDNHQRAMISEVLSKDGMNLLPISGFSAHIFNFPKILKVSHA